MTATTPVERVAAVLVASGYRRLEMPLRIGGLDFDLAAAFVGDKLSPDLVGASLFPCYQAIDIAA